MGTKSNVERLKQSAKRMDEKKASSSVLNSNANKIKRIRLNNEINFDTFESDLNSMGTTIQGIYDGWQTEETMKNTRSSIEAMQRRIGAYQEYQKMFGGADLTELADSYDTILGEWDDRTNLYGLYKDGKSYDAAKKNVELSDLFRVKTGTDTETGEDTYRGLTYDEVQAKLKEYKVGSDEHNFLSTYTGYTDLNDFDKAIFALENTTIEKQIADLKAERDSLTAEYKANNPNERTGSKEAAIKRQKSPQAQRINEINNQILELEKSKETDYYNELKTKKNQWKLDNAFDYYKHYMDDKDFEKAAQYVTTAKEATSWWGATADLESGKMIKYGDEEYEFINDVNGARNNINAKYEEGNGGASTYETKGYHLLTEDEKKVYNALYKKDKANGTNLADTFLSDMEITLSKRVYDKSTDRWNEWADSGILASAALTVATFPSKMAGNLGEIAANVSETISGKEYNPYNPLRTAGHFANDTRQYISENIAEKANWNFAGENIPAFLYNTATNIGDSALGAAIFGKGHSVIMGAGAFQQKAKEMVEAGEDESTVFSTAFASGLAEVVFEHIGLDNLFKIKSLDSGKAIFWSILKQAGIEDLEEMGTEVANIVSDSVLRGKNSELYKKYKDLMTRGYSEGEIITELAKQVGSQVTWAGIGGALSGAAMGTGASVRAYRKTKSVGSVVRGNNRIDDLLGMAQLSPRESEAYNLYTNYAVRNNSENITDAQLGSLYSTLDAEARETLESKKSTAEQKANAQKTLSDLKAYSQNNSVKGLGKKAINTLYGDEGTESIIAEGLESGKDTESYKLATEYKAKVESGKKLTTDEITNLVDANQKAYKDEVRADAEKRLAELGENTEGGKVAEIIAKKSVGERLTSTEVETLKNSEYGNLVYNEINNEEVADYTKNMDEEDAKLFLSTYDGSADLEAFKTSFNLVTNYTENKFTQDYILEHRGVLTPKQVGKIYKQKITLRNATQQKAIDDLKSKHKDKPFVYGKFDDSVIDYENKGTEGKVNWNSVGRDQKNAIVLIGSLAVEKGMDVELISDGLERGINGAYEIRGNKILIDIYAGMEIKSALFEKLILPTFSHELTHWMKEKVPELYRKYDEYIFKTLMANGKSEADILAARRKKMQDAHPGETFTDEEVRDEVIARASEDMFGKSEYIKEFLDTLSNSEKKTFVDKVKEIFQKLKKWFETYVTNNLSGADEARAIRENIDRIDGQIKLWDEMLVASIESNQALKNEGIIAEELINGISKDGTTIVGKGTIQMSERTYEKGGRDFLKNWLSNQEGLTKADKEDILRQTDAIKSLMEDIRKNNELPDYARWAAMDVVKDENGEKVLSVIVKNGDYAMNIDFSQVCKKRVALNAVLNAMVQSGDLNAYTLTETDVAELNAIIKKHDFEIACALCFVDSKRYRVGSWAESFCEGADKKKNGKMVHQYGFNEMVRSLIPKGSNIQLDEFNFTNRTIVGQPTTNLLSEMDDSELDFTLIDEILEREFKAGSKPTDLYAYAKAIKDNKELRKILNPAEIISSIGLDRIRLESPELYRLINRHQGTARPKFAHDVVAYGNDILKASNFTKEKAKMVGGVRCQSFSDFMANMVFDYVQFISELSAKELTAHTYTKEPLFVKLFGLTGMKINMSLVPKAVKMTPEQQKYFAILNDPKANKRSPEYKKAKLDYRKLTENAGLDANGNYIWEDETFPYDIAMDIVVDPRYSANCGTIAVGISDNHIAKLLNDDRISMVIPYHKSGLNHIVAMMRNIDLYNDYTKVQNTRFANGKKLEKVPDFDFYGDLYGVDGKEGTHDPKKTAENYLKWCDEHNYIPKFEKSRIGRRFRDNPNYYKLLIDFRVYDTDGTYREQQAVKPIYPAKEEFQDLILNGVVDKNGKVYGGLKQQQATTNKLDAETKQIINEFRDVLKDKYGKDVVGKQFADRDNLVENGNASRYNEINNLNDAETYSLLSYKSSESYKINALLRDGEALSESDKEFVENLDNALSKLPIHQGIVYRNISFDDFGGQEVFDAFLVEHEEGNLITYKAFTSASTKEDGYVVEGDYVVGMVIKSNNARDVEGYGNNFESEVIFPRRSKYVVDKVEKNEFGQPIIYMTEVTTNGKGNNGQLYSKERSKTVQSLSKAQSRNDNLQGISSNDTRQDSLRRDGLQGVSSKEGKIKYSNRDTEGNTLSKGQIEFFKDSKVRDENGNIKVMWHGTPAKFTVFDISNAGSNWGGDSRLGKGFYFANTKEEALEWGKSTNVIKAYLNLVNPLDLTKPTPKNIAEEIDKNIASRYAKYDEKTYFITKEQYKENLKRIKEMYLKDASLFIDTFKYDDNGNMTDGIRQFLIGLGYDGIVSKDETVAFYPEQIKETSNKNPTSNPDMQLSDRDDVSVYDKLGELNNLIKENEKLKEDVERLKERLKIERQVTNGNYFNENQLDAVAGHLRNKVGSTIDKKELISLLKDVYSYIAHSPDLNWYDMFAQCYDIAKAMINESKPITETNDYAKMILRDINKSRISLNDSQIQEAKHRFGDKYRNAFMGKVIIANDGLPLDTQWKSWASEYPDFFDATITDADQITALYDVYGALKSASEMVVEYDVEEQTRYLAREIYNQYWNVSPIRTTADKYDKQIKLLNFKHREAMKEFRDNYEEKLKTQHKADKEKYKELVKNIRERKDKEIAEVKKLGKERLDAYKENAERKTLIQGITGNALTLNKWLTTNSKDYHIHEAMKGPVIKLLQAIDFSSKKMLKTNIPTQRDVTFVEAFADVKAMLLQADNMEVGLEELYGHDLAESIEMLVQASYNLVGDNNYVINQMSLQELQSLDNLVKSIKRVVAQLNKFHTVQHNKGAVNLANTFMEYGDKLGKLKKQDGKIAKFLKFRNATPYYFFKRLGEAGAKIFEAFQDGWDKLAFNTKTVIDYANATYTNKEVREWGKETKSFTLLQPNGSKRTFEITTAQIMALHCVSKQEDALRHLLSSGMTLSRVDKKGNVVADYENISLTMNDLAEIVGTLTNRQKEVANKLQEFMNTVCAEWGNEISMARFAVKMFTTPNYFPIKVSPTTIPTDNTKEFDNASLFRLLNMSFTKARNKFAEQSIEIGDIFDIFAQHSSDMAKYNALALPVLDFNKFYQQKGKTGDNKEYGVDNTLRTVFGEEAVGYLKRFVRDINGSQNVSRDIIGKTFFKNAKVAAVANNLRVVLLQPTAYFKASAVMDNKYLVSAPLFSIAKLKRSITKAEKYCGIIQWKSLGYYDTDISRGIKEKIKHSDTFKDKAIEFSLKGAEIADKVTFGVLWNACELEIRNTHKDLKVGSEEFYQAVGKRLREIVYATQVVDSTMTRSDMMRSADGGDKMLTTFGSEPTIAYNMLLDIAMQYSLDKKAYGKQEAHKKNGKKIRKVITAYVVTNAVAALVESGFDAFRDDDEEEMDIEEFMKVYLKNFAFDLSIGNKLPLVKEAYSAMQGYSSSRLDTQWFEYFFSATTNWGKILSGNGEGKGDKAIKDALKLASNISGYAFYNIYRDLMATLYKLEILEPEEIEDLFG